jgi:hypothetical protein
VRVSGLQTSRDWRWSHLKKKRFVLPIEVLVAVGINLVVAVLGYYAVVLWGFFNG